MIRNFFNIKDESRLYEVFLQLDTLLMIIIYISVGKKIINLLKRICKKLMKKKKMKIGNRRDKVK